jgi:hypothetical protein
VIPLRSAEAVLSDLRAIIEAWDAYLRAQGLGSDAGLMLERRAKAAAEICALGFSPCDAERWLAPPLARRSP